MTPEVNLDDFKKQFTEEEHSKLASAVNMLAFLCHNRARAAGWWNDLQTGDDLRKTRNIPEMLCLMHSEISEAMEGHRKDLMDDKLKNRKQFEVELADLLIRTFDLAGSQGLDIGGAMIEKMEYNLNRADHKPENRKADGGKKF